MDGVCLVSIAGYGRDYDEQRSYGARYEVYDAHLAIGDMIESLDLRDKSYYLSPTNSPCIVELYAM